MDNSEYQEKKRRPYPTAAQKARLVSRLESDSDLSNGKYSTTFSKNEAERRWNDIADELNSIPGVVKSWIEWRKTWQDMKCSWKKKKVPKKKVQNIEESASIFNEDLTTTNQDDFMSDHDDRPMPVEYRDISNTPKLMIELEGNGNSISVTCAKKENISAETTSAKTLNKSHRITFFKNRRYTYDYLVQNNICRLCWSATNSIKSIENDTAITQKILEYVGVDMTIGTPKTVCSLCLVKIESFIKFKRLCQEADRKLKIIFSNCNPICRKLKSERNESIFKKGDKKLSIKQEKLMSDCNDSDDDFPNDTFCSPFNTLESTENITEHNIGAHRNELRFFQCYGCTKSFVGRLKLCKDTMEYSCGDCCKCKPTKLRSEKKMKKCEEPPKVYKCQICSEMFKVHLLWRKHMAVHRKEMKFVCESCGRVLKNKNSLREHMRIHTSNKQLKCPHCDYRATLKTSLVYHIRLHTGERPYACDRCPYTCVTSSNLRRHINTTHLGIKAFKCQICSKEYMYKRSLKEHITSAHQGRKENMCKRCGALYFRFEHLRKHILIKHRKVIKKVKDDYFEVNDAGYKKMSKYKPVGPSEVTI